MTDGAIAALLRRDRVIVCGALAVLVAAASLYLVYLSREMNAMATTDMAGMPGMAMPAIYEWNWVEVATLGVMWAVMMIAMMTPAAAPMILTFAAVHRRRQAENRPAVPTAVFVLGYFVVWTAFSAVAALGQAGLHAAALLSPKMTAESPLLGGVLLVVAGVFQWTPLKRTCLNLCRSPLSFVMSRWREGHAGAFVMGLRHGLYCLGCCWALMTLLFVAGVMNLVWVAVIAVAVLVEKTLPRGELVGRITGGALVIAGAWLAARAVLAV
jgi:predicted metal-binding membrane protein